MKLPPISFELHGDRLEMTFVARFSARAADAPYEKYGAAVELPVVTAEAIAQATKGLFRCAVRTMDALERNGATEGALAYQVDAGRGPSLIDAEEEPA